MFKNNQSNAFYTQRYQKENSKLLRERDDINNNKDNRSSISSLTGSQRSQKANTTTMTTNNNNTHKTTDSPRRPLPQKIPLTKNFLHEGNIGDDTNNHQAKKKTFPLPPLPVGSLLQKSSTNNKKNIINTSRASVCSESSGQKSCISAKQQQQKEETEKEKKTPSSSSSSSSSLSREKLESWVNSVPSELPAIPSARASAVSGRVGAAAATAAAKKKKRSSSSSSCSLSTFNTNTTDGQSVFSATTLSHHAASSALVSGVTTINKRLEAIEERIQGEKELRNDLRKALQQVRSIVEKQKGLEIKMKRDITKSSNSASESGSQTSSGLRRKVFM